MTYADGGRATRRPPSSSPGASRRSGDGESHLRKAYALLVYRQMQAGAGRRGATEPAGAGSRLFPEDAELRFRGGVLLHEARPAGGGGAGVPRGPRRARGAALHQRRPGHPRVQGAAEPGRGVRRNGGLARAEEQWRLVVARGAGLPRGLAGAGRGAAAAGQGGGGRGAGRAARGGRPCPGRGAALAAHLAAAAGDFAGAKRKFREATATRPDDPDLLEMMCRFLFDRGDPAEAEAAVKALCAAPPGRRRLSQPRDDLHPAGAGGEGGGGLPAVGPAPPVVRETWLRLGDALRDAGQWREAVAAWQGRAPGPRQRGGGGGAAAGTAPRAVLAPQPARGPRPAMTGLRGQRSGRPDLDIGPELPGRGPGSGSAWTRPGNCPAVTAPPSLSGAHVPNVEVALAVK